MVVIQNKYNIFIDVRQLIKNILREEFRNLSSNIEELLQPTVDRYSDYVCEVQVFQDVMNPKKYSLRVFFVGGPSSKIWPMTQAVQSSREKVMKEMWETIYKFTGLSVELDSSTVKECKDSIPNKQEQNESTVSSTIKRRANQQTLKKYITKGEINYPTLCDDFEDGYEYADAVIDYAIYKLLDDFDEDMYEQDYNSDVMDYLRNMCRNEFGKYLIDIYETTCTEEELDEQEKKESEITERCWKGYTQKGMKTMFGKRYPNCVKIKK
jgi:predicted transcriptional regulator